MAVLTINSKQYKVGVGVITTGEREIPNYLNEDVIVEVYVDKERNGPAHSRNRVLKALYDKGCDYMFLMDDDVSPLREDWVELTIGKALERGVHFIGWPHIFDSTPSRYEDGMLFPSGVTVQFAMLSRKCVEEVGYFDKRYGKYGPEDVSYTYRVHLAHLGAKDGEGWEVPLTTLCAIHVEDMYSCFTKSVVSDEVKKEGMEKGWKLLDELVKESGPIYVPFE